MGETEDLSNNIPELTEKMKSMSHQWHKYAGAKLPEISKDIC
jgi:hypothetical protein